MNIVQAVERSDAAAVKKLLEEGASINRRDSGGNTLAVLAVRAGSSEILELLIEHGVDLGADEPVRASALVEALWHADESCVDVLLSAGRSVSKLRFRGGSALHVVLGPLRWRRPGARLRLLKRCLAEGLDPTSMNDQGVTGLHLAAESDDPELIGVLLQVGCHVDLEDSRGLTPLATAATQAKPNAVRSLLRAGADARHPSVMRQVSYSRYASLKVVDQLREAGPPSECLDQAMAIAAVKAGDTERVSAYLEAGGDPDTPLNSGSLIEMAVYERQIECLRIAVAAGANLRGPAAEGHDSRPWLLKAALNHETLDCLELLIEAGVPLNVVVEPRYETKATAIGYCVRHGLDAAYELLLQHGADPWLELEGTESAMWWAAAEGRFTFLDRVVPGWRDDPRLLDPQVIWYARSGDAENLRRALGAGGDPNTADGSIGSALWLAVHKDHLDCVQLLLSAGADPDWNEHLDFAPPRRIAEGRSREMLRVFQSYPRKRP